MLFLQLQPGDFDGKELSLKLRPDGRLGGFESSSGTYDHCFVWLFYSFMVTSCLRKYWFYKLMDVFVMIGKSYDVVSFAAQEPNATVFVSSPNESKVGMWLRLSSYFVFENSC